MIKRSDLANGEDEDRDGQLPDNSGVTQWSTDAVPPSQRLDYWLGVVRRGLDEHVVTTSNNLEFGASLTSANCGAVQVNNVEGTPQLVCRTEATIRRSEGRSFYLRCAIGAPWAAGQEGAVSRLSPGDMMLFDSVKPYSMNFTEAAALITLQLPVDWVESWLTDPEAHCGRRIDATSGWGQPLSSFVQQLTPQVAAKPPLPAKLMTDQLGSLLALGTNDPAVKDEESPSTVEAFVRRATEFLHQRYAEQGLTAQAVAEDLYISERTLHRYFARSGGTFLQHLMRHRMAVAERMLRDPRFDRITVSEIGRRVGLTDASHFIRQCRSSLGVTPASLRRMR